MNEYGIFQSIIEGDQAEAYKKRRTAEQNTEKKKENDRIYRKGLSMSSELGEDKAQQKRANTTYKNKTLNKKFVSGTASDSDRRAQAYAVDADDRHSRRHPNSESSIPLI